MKLLIPLLRADFCVNETYEYIEEEPLEPGISAFGGLGDVEVTREDVEVWKAAHPGPVPHAHAAGRPLLHQRSGKDLVLEAVTRDLAELSPRYCRAPGDTGFPPRSPGDPRGWRSPRARSTSGRSGSIPPPSGWSGWAASSRPTSGSGPGVSVSTSTAGSTWWAGAPCATLLAAYIGTRPEAIRFRYGPRGKPFLEPPLNAGGLQFNLSNSDEMALVGFVLGREIGVDIEYLRPMPDCEEISERFFSESERRSLRSDPGRRQGGGLLQLLDAQGGLPQGGGGGARGAARLFRRHPRPGRAAAHAHPRRGRRPCRPLVLPAPPPAPRSTSARSPSRGGRGR